MLKINQMKNIIILTCFINILNISFSFSDSNVEQKFNCYLSDWLEYYNNHPSSFLVDDEINESFSNIIKLGPPVLPHIYKSMKDNSNFASQLLYHAMGKITKRKFPEGTLVGIDCFLANKNTEIWIKWWEEGRLEVDEIFKKQYQNYKYLNNIEKKKIY